MGTCPCKKPNQYLIHLGTGYPVLKDLWLPSQVWVFLPKYDPSLRALQHSRHSSAWSLRITMPWTCSLGAICQGAPEKLSQRASMGVGTKLSSSYNPFILWSQCNSTCLLMKGWKSCMLSPSYVEGVRVYPQEHPIATHHPLFEPNPPLSKPNQTILHHWLNKPTNQQLLPIRLWLRDICLGSYIVHLMQ